MKKSPLSVPPKIEEASSSHGQSLPRDHIASHARALPRNEEERSKRDRFLPRDNMAMHELAHILDEKPAGLKRIEHRSEDINECAEAFIQRFRQQLQIQRLESIENYEKMLARGL